MPIRSRCTAARSNRLWIPLLTAATLLGCLLTAGSDLPAAEVTSAASPEAKAETEAVEEWAQLPEKNGRVTLPAQEWRHFPGPRSIEVTVHYPGGQLQNVTAETGLMLTLHNWGGTHCVGTASPTYLAQNFNVIALCVNYLQSGREGIDLKAPYDFGLLQATDALRGLSWAAHRLRAEEKPFHAGRVYVTGGSGGGNVTLMAVRLAPRTFTVAIDMCGMARLSDDIAFGLPGGSGLNAKWSQDPSSSHWLSPGHQQIRDLGDESILAATKKHGCTTKFFVVHGTTDSTCPFADARRMVEHMQAAELDVTPHFLTDDDLDGKIFTSTGHPLGNRTLIVQHVAGELMQPDSTKAVLRSTPADYDRRDSLDYPTSDGRFVIDWTAGYPMVQFVAQTEDN